MAAFVGAAGDADHAAAFDLGDLADDAADRARGARDDDGLAGLRFADQQQAAPGGDARHAADRELRRGGDILEDLAQALAVAGGDGLPAEIARDQIADREARVAGLDDLADDFAAHHAADLDGFDIRLGVAHATAHVGVEREPVAADAQLAVGERCERRFGDAEVLEHGRPGRAAGEQDLGGGGRGGVHGGFSAGGPALQVDEQYRHGGRGDAG